MAKPPIRADRLALGIGYKAGGAMVDGARTGGAYMNWQNTSGY